MPLLSRLRRGGRIVWAPGVANSIFPLPCWISWYVILVGFSQKLFEII